MLYINEQQRWLIAVRGHTQLPQGFQKIISGAFKHGTYHQASFLDMTVGQ